MLNDTQIKQLNNMNAAAQRAQLGTLLGVLDGVGDVYYLDPTNGTVGATGTAPSSAVKTMEEAKDLLTTGQNDVLVYIAGASGVNLEEALVWDLSYTHLVGACAPTRVGQRSRIFQKSTLTGASPLITVSGSGCVFKDLYAFQGVDDATSLVNVRVSGSRNFFQNFHFAGGGHATQAIDGGASLQISGGSENTFQNCVIGVDTVAAGNGMAGLSFAATGGAARNRFLDCDFTMYAGHAGAIFVEILGDAGIDRYQEFINPKFINLSATTMTQVFAVVAGINPANKRVLISGDYAKIGATKWDDGDRGIVYGRLAATSAADTVGNYTELIS